MPSPFSVRKCGKSSEMVRAFSKDVIVDWFSMVFHHHQILLQECFQNHSVYTIDSHFSYSCFLQSWPLKIKTYCLSITVLYALPVFVKECNDFIFAFTSFRTIMRDNREIIQCPRTVILEFSEGRTTWPASVRILQTSAFFRLGSRAKILHPKTPSNTRCESSLTTCGWFSRWTMVTTVNQVRTSVVQRGK